MISLVFPRQDGFVRHIDFEEDAAGASIDANRNFEGLGQDGGEKMRRDVEGSWPAIMERFAAEVAREVR